MGSSECGWLKLCGCPVVLLENGKNKVDDLLEIDKLALTNNVSEIDKAISELKKYADELQKRIDNNKPEVQKFIKITQEWAYLRLKCRNA